MQEKRTLYLAGKITGDPYYFTKFYNAQKKLEEGGFIVVNPALLPAEGFTWEAYMRMSGAMRCLRFPFFLLQEIKKPDLCLFLFQPFICRAAIIFVNLEADEIQPALTIASDQGTSASGVCVQYLHTFSGEEGKNPRIQLHGLLRRVNCPVVQQFNAIADKNARRRVEAGIR